MSSTGSDRRSTPPNAAGKASKAGSGGGEGLLGWISSLFGGLRDSEGEKKRALRGLAKDLQRSRYKFFRPKGGEALPGLAKFFYETYKIVAPAQVLLANASSSGALRAFVIESFLTDDQKALSTHLTEGYIVERSKTVPLKQLQEEVKHEVTNFWSVFDGETSRRIDEAYNTLLEFINFVNFDYYFLLKKFDSAMPERNFSYHPKFDAINGEYVTEDLMDFLEIFLPLDFETDWKRIFGAFAEYRNTEVIQYEAWAKFAPAALDLRESGILEQIVRYVKKEPDWVALSRKPGERIVEPFLEKLKTQVETLLQRIIQERRNSKIDEVANQIFGTTVVLRMKNYTDKANVVFAKKMLGGYTQTQAMNYLKAFLMDFFKKDIREMVDLVIIRGQWATALQSQQLSEAYHGILEVADRIVEFDDNLADEGEVGTRMRSALAKAERDRDALKYLRTVLKDTNDKATAMISRAAMSLISVGRFVKILVEDLARPHHEILLNWKEVEGQSPRHIKEWFLDVYKKIYYMVQLLQYFAKEGNQGE